MATTVATATVLTHTITAVATVTTAAYALLET
jgi:hypothetical protein